MRTVYFDHAATTPVDEEVLEAMLPLYREHFGNPSSAHGAGQTVNVAVEEARETIAQIIGAEPSEIIFTSGGTESDNAAIRGVVEATGKHEVITTRVEHHAVLHPIEQATSPDIQPVFLDVDAYGRVSADQVADAITEETALVSLMHVNNELGIINPIADIAEVCKERGVPIHSDTVQSAGKLPLNVQDMGVDLLSISAHKMYGPKGIGILYVRNGTPWNAWMLGGSQERRRRGGTLNAPGIVGLGKAFKLADKRLPDLTARLENVSDRLVAGVEEQFGDQITFNSSQEYGVPHIMNMTIRDRDGAPLDGEMLLLNLDMEGIHLSNGSACTSGAIEASHVLTTLGLSEAEAKSSIRVSMGKSNTGEDIDYFLQKLDEVITRMSR